MISFPKIVTPLELKNIIDKTVDSIYWLAEKKGGEYSGDEDCLANFKRNARILDVPVETIWAVYAAKHWDAIMQYVKDIQHDTTRQRTESLNGRLDDLIVYCLLLKAILPENS